MRFPPNAELAEIFKRRHPEFQHAACSNRQSSSGALHGPRDCVAPAGYGPPRPLRRDRSGKRPSPVRRRRSLGLCGHLAPSGYTLVPVGGAGRRMPTPSVAGTRRGTQRDMARSMWRGAIQFGLVTIPVRLYLATESRGISFNMLHESCLNRIQMKTYCPHHDEVISRGDTVKGYEYAKDQYVVITDDDLASVPLKTVRSIEIDKFVPAIPVADEPARYVKQAYYVEPEAIGKKAYALLREVLAEKGLAAICKVVIKDREALAALNPQGSVMVLETLHWPDEIRATEELDLPDEEIEVKPAERAMAAQLIAAMIGSFDPAEYRDEYRAALEEVIEAKVQGREIVEPEAPAVGGQLVDLMAMLEASVSAARTARSNRETEEAAEAEADPGADGGRGAGAGRGAVGRSAAKRPKKAVVPVEEVEEREVPARKVARRKTA